MSLEELQQPHHLQNSAQDQEVIDVPAFDERSRFSKFGNGILVGAAATSLILEQSPLNEAFRATVGLNVLQQTESAVAVGVVVFGVTAAIEMVPATLISLGLNANSESVDKLKARFSKKAEEEVTLSQTSDSASLLKKITDSSQDTAIALGVGAGLVTVRRHMADPDPSLSKDLKNSAGATGVVAGVSGFIGYLAAGGITHAEKVGLETPAEYVVDYGTDPLFWMSALGVGYGVYFAKKGFDKFRQRNNSNQSKQRKEV